MKPVVAALYVSRKGPYWDDPRCDCWDAERDARLYDGPLPVVAHPPCERWGRYWHGGPNSTKYPRERKRKGDDGGCFAAALAAVRRFGGVLEHPADSAAWDAFGLIRPPFSGGWWSSGIEDGGWTCRVEQGHYGHRARKGTWLYAHGVTELPSLIWGPSNATAKLDDGFHSAEERASAAGSDQVERLSKLERLATPPTFAELLISIAKKAGEAERLKGGGR